MKSAERPDSLMNWLSESWRTTVQMREEGKTFAEIGKALGVPGQTAKQYYEKAVRLLERLQSEADREARFKSKEYEIFTVYVTQISFGESIKRVNVTPVDYPPGCVFMEVNESGNPIESYYTARSEGKWWHRTLNGANKRVVARIKAKIASNKKKIDALKKNINELKKSAELYK